MRGSGSGVFRARPLSSGFHVAGFSSLGVPISDSQHKALLFKKGSQKGPEFRDLPVEGAPTYLSTLKIVRKDRFLSQLWALAQTSISETASPKPYLCSFGSCQSLWCWLVRAQTSLSDNPKP